MSKLIVIVGITGNQGHSVSQRFLQDPNYRIRGITRNPTSPTAQTLLSQGIELVTADLNDPTTLATAFAGANLIFSVTNYWEPFFRPDCRATAASRGVWIGKYAYEVEVQQGKNIVDAVAKTAVESLDENGFVVSTLSSARQCSGGRFEEVYHFDGKADVFPGYVREKYPELARKMSCVQTGCFMSSYRLAPSAYFAKQPDGSFQTQMPMSPSKPIQHLDVNADTGVFVYAMSKMPPGKDYMCAGTTCTWPEYCETWSKATGKKCEYKQISLEEMIEGFGDKDAGKEIGEMFSYSNDPGYDGGMELVGPEDLRKAGIECPMTSLEKYMKRQDWSQVIDA